MEKHIQLVGILNIVYRSLVIFAALILFVIAAGFRHFIEMLVRLGPVDMRDFPSELLDIIPAILVVVALIMSVVSIVGIVAAAGVLGRKRWGRVLMLVVSFLNLLRVPVGTLLGGYSIWVLLNDETIRLFDAPRTGA
jgi:hypothetical protein